MQSLFPCAALGTPQDAADIDVTVHDRCTDKKLDEYSEASPNEHGNSSPDTCNSQCRSPTDSVAAARQ
jgi:hypothetical protein